MKPGPGFGLHLGVELVRGIVKSQGELFAGTPKPTPPKQPTLFSNVKGVDFSRMNGEKPGHKYIRRYKGKSGGWEYVYRDAQGKEFAGDEQGKPLPRHRDWQEGDAVHIGDRDAHLVGFADTMAVVRDTKGETFTVPMKEIEHSTERQARLRGKSALPSKWQSVVDEHDDDLAQGEQTGKYELGDNKGEVMFKRKLAAEERDRRAEEGDPEDGESYADQIKREPESQSELPFGRVAEAKPLYHGTSRTLEGKLQVRKNDKAGVGWNSATLGNAVYLTESEPAAKLFSHVSEQNSYLTNPDPEARTEGANNAGLGNVYKVKLKTGAKVLDASDPLPVDKVKAALKEAGLREDTIGSFNDKELTDFERVMDLLRYAHDVKNGPVYLTKKLGYDALRVKEGSWQNWAYFPEHLGLGPDKFKETPTTVAVYNEDAIEGYEPHKMKKEEPPKREEPRWNGKTYEELKAEIDKDPFPDPAKMRALEDLALRDAEGNKLEIGKVRKSKNPSRLRWNAGVVMKQKGAKGAEKSMAAFLLRLFKGAQMALFGDGPQVGDVKMQNGESYKLESRKTWNRPRWIKQETNSNTPEPKKMAEGKRRGKLNIASVPLDHKPEPEVPKSETSHNKETAEKVEKKEPPKDKRAGLPKPPKDEKEYVKSSEYHKKLAVDYFDENGKQVASSRTKKASPTGVKVGDWRIDDKYNGVYGRWIEQVVEFDPSELVPSEDSLERMDDVERYAEWNKEGTEPPPINVNQGEDGKFIITDGHRRWLAAKRSGNKVKAWVSWTHPTGKLDYAGKPILTGLTHELANAPEPEEARKQVKAARPTVPENVQKYIEHEIAADFPRNIMHEIETAYLSRDRGEIPANCYRYVSLYRPTFGWLKASDLDAGEVAAREIDGGRKTVFFTTKPISIDKLTRYELTPEGNRTRGRMVLDYMEARGEQAAELVKYDGDSKPRVAVYHKSAKPEYKCVVGYFDERGPFSDDYGNDPEKMIGEALSSGYRECNPGTLDAMAPDFDAELLAAMMKKSMSSWITRRF